MVIRQIIGRNGIGAVFQKASRDGNCARPRANRRRHVRDNFDTTRELSIAQNAVLLFGQNALRFLKVVPEFRRLLPLSGRHSICVLRASCGNARGAISLGRTRVTTPSAGKIRSAVVVFPAPFGPPMK